LQKAPNYRGLIDWNWGWNWRNEKFNGQLRVKLHKSETKDRSENFAPIRGWNLRFKGENCIIFKVWSQSGVYMRYIRNQRTKLRFTKTTSFWLLFIFFFNFLWNDRSKRLICAFNAYNLHQIWHTLHVNDHMTSIYTLV